MTHHQHKGDGLPDYKGSKTSCDYLVCRKGFRGEDVIAAMTVQLVGFSRPYEMVFCFHDGDFRCMYRWQFQYGIEKGKKENDDKPNFKLMIYRDKRPNSGDTGRFPAYI